jgi:hypothetical protein
VSVRPRARAIATREGVVFSFMDTFLVSDKNRAGRFE